MSYRRIITLEHGPVSLLQPLHQRVFVSSGPDLYDKVFFHDLCLLHKSGIISLSSWCHTVLCMFQNFIDNVFVQSYAHPAQCVGHFFVSTPQILNAHVKAGQSSHPSVSDGIQIGCCEDVGEWVVVSSNDEMAIL